MRALSRRVCSSGLTSSQYLSRMIPDSTIIFSNSGTTFRNFFTDFLGGEAHHPLDAGTVVPAAIEDHDLAGRRQVRKIALHIHLRLFALGGRGERDDAEHARAHPLRDRLDRAALAGAVAPLEDDADLEALLLHPLLQLDELDVQLLQLLQVSLLGELGIRRRRGALRLLRRDRVSTLTLALSFFLALLASLSFFLPCP